jgi:hypothetical protein
MLTDQIELILLLTGLATSGALVMFVAPTLTMKMLFRQTSSDTLSILIARHWGLLIFLVGALLVYAAYHTEIRSATIIVAVVEKLVFALMVFVSHFRRYRIAFIVALADTSMAIVYMIYLIGP